MRTNIGGFGVTEGILLQLGYMALIAYTDSKILNLILHDVLPIDALPDTVKHIKILDIGVGFVFLNALIYSYQNISCGLQKSSESTL